MNRLNIGEFEELILLITGILRENAYGVKVMEELEVQTGRQVHISAVHSALRRLESKGFLKSSVGGATTERGGRRKRNFTLTQKGHGALSSIREMRNGLFKQLPKLSFKV